MVSQLTLYELNNLVRGTVEGSLTDDYWIQAELSEVREGYNGHCYLELIEKDSAGRQLIAKARGMIWHTTYCLLKPYFERETGQLFAAGIKVLVQVSVTFHELYSYSLIVKDIDPSYTIGDMARRRKEILQQLEKEGILNDNKDLSFPLLANRIAVISSATAAGYGDFCHQLYQNEYRLKFKVGLFPAVMQGEKVEQSVLAALDAILAQCDEWDVVVIIRGGGATSDLSGFDTYLLAAACAQFPLPVITGIGHERDDTVLDMVAHTRVKTPTAAAALIVSHQLGTASRLEDLCNRISRDAQNRMQVERERMERLLIRLPLAFTRMRSEGEHRLEAYSSRLQHAVIYRTEKERHRLQLYAGRLEQKWPVMLEREKFRLQLLKQRCEAADPALLLKRGYSMTYKGKMLVRDASQLNKGDELVTVLENGTVRSIVK